jgi:hypothetical protein
MEIQGTTVLDSSYLLTPASTTATAAVGRSLPADIALLAGKTAGSTHIGVWR